MFRPIRMDHTNCLQVAIKTLQFTNAHLCSRMMTYADVHEEAQAAVGAANTNVGIVCNRMRLLERAVGAHFT
jgi:hypothetical protein